MSIISHDRGFSSHVIRFGGGGLEKTYLSPAHVRHHLNGRVSTAGHTVTTTTIQNRQQKFQT